MRRKWRVMDCCVTNLWSLQENCNQDYYFSQTHILTSWHKLQAHHRRLNMLPQWKGNQISFLLSPRILLSCRLSYIAFFWIYKNDKFCVERKMLICNFIFMPYNIKYVAPIKRKIVLNKKYCISVIWYINYFSTSWENDIYCLCQQKNLLHQYLDDGSLISIIFLTYLNATRFRQTILRDKSLPFMVSRYIDNQVEIWWLTKVSRL